MGDTVTPRDAVLRRLSNGHNRSQTSSDNSVSETGSASPNSGNERTEDPQAMSDDDTQSSATRAVEALTISASPSQSSDQSDLHAPYIGTQSPDRVVLTDSSATQGREYALSIVSQPVQCTITGSGLCEPPLIVQLVVKATSEPDAPEVVVEEDLPYLIANVSLWDASGRDQVFPQLGSAPQRPTAMRGDLVTSGQVYRDTDGRDRIFFVFRSLQIVRQGQWRLGVSLISIRPAEDADQCDAGTVLVGVKSSAVTNAVPEDSPLAFSNVQIDRRTRRLLETLRDQGADLSGSEQDSIDSRD